MRYQTRQEWRHIPSGRSVLQYQGGRIRRTAPKEPGLYTLYEILGEHNAHLGWKWVREIREVKA